jgi:thiol-disulfide isomerase/thioredoxin
MKKLFLTICALCVATGTYAQNIEKEEYERATAALRAEREANEEALATLNGQYPHTPAQHSENMSRQAKRDSLNYLVDETMLALLEEKMAPVSDVFVKELKEIGSSIYYWSPNYPKYLDLTARAQALWGRLSEAQKASEDGVEIKYYLFPLPKVEVGDPLPDMTLVDMAGATHSLSEYAGKGKYLLLDFWDAWCGACLAAMPEIGEIANANPETLTVVGINMDDKREDWVSMTEKHSVTWVNLNTPWLGEVSNRFRVTGRPYQVVVSPEGIVVDAWMGYGKGLLRHKLKKFIPDLK